MPVITTCGTSRCSQVRMKLLPRVRLEDDVQHHLAERRIGGVAVRLPRAGIGIDLQRTGARFAIDLHGGLDEIRARTAVPLAELHDSNCFSAGGAEIPAESPGKPQCLEFQLRRQGTRRGFRESERRMPDRF